MATSTDVKLQTLRAFRMYLDKNVHGVFGMIPNEGCECLPDGIEILERLFENFEKAVIAGNENEFVKKAPEEEYAMKLDEDE